MIKNAFRIVVIFFSCQIFAMEVEDDIRLLDESPRLSQVVVNYDGPDLISTNKIPKEIFYLILTFLDEESLAQFGRTSKINRQKIIGQLLISFPTTLWAPWTTADLLQAMSKLEEVEKSPCPRGTAYRRGMIRIAKAAQLVKDSFHFKRNKGPERIDELKKKYDIVLDDQDPLKVYLSSLARDSICLRVSGGVCIALGCMLIGLIIEEQMQYHNAINSKIDYARSKKFIEDMRQDGKMTPSFCYTECLSEIFTQNIDSRGYCAKNTTAIENFRNFTQSLFDNLKDRCSFVQSIPYTLNDVENAFNQFANETCHTIAYGYKSFSSASVEAIKDTTNLMARIHTRIDDGNQTAASGIEYMAISAGKLDPQCVAETLVPPPSPIWAALGACSSPFLLVAAMLFVSCYMGY